MSNLLTLEITHQAQRATRSPANGPCRCVRRTCWHTRDCRGNGIVRVLRVADPVGTPRTSVILCRECAAPTQRNRVA
jgi:hypothetical protein